MTEHVASKVEPPAKLFPNDAPHPYPEALLRYCDDLLTPEEAAVVRNHVMSCAKCAEQVLRFRQSLEPGSRQSKAETPAFPEAAASRQQPWIEHFFAKPLVRYSYFGLVAALPVVVAWLFLSVPPSPEMVARQLETIAPAQPHMLFPVRRDGNNRASQTDPLDQRLVVADQTTSLVLDALDLEPGLSYALRIVDAAGKPLNTFHDVAPSHHYFSLVLPANALPPGTYWVELHQTEAGRLSRKLVDFSFGVVVAE